MPPPRVRADARARDDAGMAEKDVLGRAGEDRAARYFEAEGFTVLSRNWRCRDGEIDLVVADGTAVIVVEVKTRRGTGFGDPVEAVTVAKALRLRRLAAAYLRAHGGHPGPVRVDVVGVLCRRGLPPEVRHVVGVGS